MMQLLRKDAFKNQTGEGYIRMHSRISNFRTNGFFRTFELSASQPYSVSLVLTLPETHYDRLTANTPMYVGIGSKELMRPIPTPSRSYFLSVSR